MVTSSTFNSTHFSSFFQTVDLSKTNLSQNIDSNFALVVTIFSIHKTTEVNTFLKDRGV